MMRLNMPQLIAAHQQLERKHLPTSFPPPTHSSRGRERGARCVWRVSTVHPHTQRQARERGSRERRAGTRLYVNHGIYATVSTCAATFDPLSTLRSGFWWCVASHNPRSGVWLFSHTPKNIAPRHCARPWSSCGLRGCRVGTVPRCATCFSCCCSRSAQGHTRQDYIRCKHGIILERIARTTVLRHSVQYNHTS